METVAALVAGATPVARRRFAPWLVLAGTLGIPCVYLPTLASQTLERLPLTFTRR